MKYRHGQNDIREENLHTSCQSRKKVGKEFLGDVCEMNCSVLGRTRVAKHLCVGMDADLNKASFWVILDFGGYILCFLYFILGLYPTMARYRGVFDTVCMNFLHRQMDTMSLK